MILAIRPLDLLTLAAYLAGMLAMGFWFSKRNTSTEEYFLGGRSFPGWAIGLSMLGTSISSITFLAFPGKAYAGDWQQLISNLTLPIVALLAVAVFIPFFRRGNLTSAFEYLGERFGPWARLYGTASFVLLQGLRLATVLYLVSIPVHLLSGLPPDRHWQVIVAVGLFIGIYTVLGGINAVIWTDVIQSIVLWGGGLLCVGYIAVTVPGGLGEIVEIGVSDQKFSFGETDFDLARETIWVSLLLGIFNWLAYTTSDQNVVQRYVASKSLREARKATMIYAGAAVPTWAFFFFVGTCVYAFYQTFPSDVVSGMKADEVFPHFILTQLPAGLAGLVIAGVLAAAMSSLDSSINSIATILTVDVLKPYLLPGRDDRTYLRIAQGISLLAGLVMIAGAVLISFSGQESTNDLNWMLTSVFGGCLVGLFLVGFFSTRIGAWQAAMGLVVAVLLNVYLGASLAEWIPRPYRIEIHQFWVGILVNVVFAGVAYLLALIFSRPGNAQRLKGLTVWTMDRDPC